MAENSASFKDQVKQWTKETYLKAKARTALLRIGVTGHADDMFRTSVRQRYGEIDSISFKMVRYMVFVHKGVGKGNKISDPGRKKKPKEWFNPIIDERLPQLADMVAAEKADSTVNVIQIK
ncbi:hypothetical protein D3C72_728640 [compost metagenome]